MGIEHGRRLTESDLARLGEPSWEKDWHEFEVNHGERKPDQQTTIRPPVDEGKAATTSG
jgi:hypothetical protein